MGEPAESLSRSNSPTNSIVSISPRSNTNSRSFLWPVTGEASLDLTQYLEEISKPTTLDREIYLLPSDLDPEREEDPALQAHAADLETLSWFKETFESTAADIGEFLSEEGRSFPDEDKDAFRRDSGECQRRVLQQIARKIEAIDGAILKLRLKKTCLHTQRYGNAAYFHQFGLEYRFHECNGYAIQRPSAQGRISSEDLKLLHQDQLVKEAKKLSEEASHIKERILVATQTLRCTKKQIGGKYAPQLHQILSAEANKLLQWLDNSLLALRLKLMQLSDDVDSKKESLTQEIKSCENRITQIQKYEVHSPDEIDTLQKKIELNKHFICVLDAYLGKSDDRLVTEWQYTDTNMQWIKNTFNCTADRTVTVLPVQDAFCQEVDQLLQELVGFKESWRIELIWEAALDRAAQESLAGERTQRLQEFRTQLSEEGTVADHIAPRFRARIQKIDATIAQLNDMKTGLDSAVNKVDEEYQKVLKLLYPGMISRTVSAVWSAGVKSVQVVSSIPSLVSSLPGYLLGGGSPARTEWNSEVNPGEAGGSSAGSGTDSYRELIPED